MYKPLSTLCQFLLLTSVYCSCVLELGIFVSQLTWLFRTRKIRKQADARGMSFDDVLMDCEVYGIPFKFAERVRRTKQFPDMETGRNQSEFELARSASVK
jgi:hypothetical protein